MIIFITSSVLHLKIPFMTKLFKVITKNLTDPPAVEIALGLRYMNKKTSRTDI